MQITFGKMTLHNFMSYAECEFDWSGMNGIELITGVNEDNNGNGNGAGKTTLFLGISYALYGSVPTGLEKNNINNMFTDDNNEMNVTLDFFIDNTRYYVEQGTSGKRREPFCRLYTYDEDGSMNEISRGTCTETRKFIAVELIGTPMDIFMRTIMLNTDPKYNFYNLEQSKRVGFFERMFGLTYFKDMCNLFTSSSKSLSRDLVAENEILANYSSTLDDYNEKNSEFETTKKTMIEEATRKYDEENKSFTVCNDNFNSVASLNLTKNDDLIRRLDEGLNKVKTKISDLYNQLRINDNTVSSNSSAISKNETYVKKWKSLTSTLCDSCSKKVSDRFNLGEFEKEIHEKIVENSDMNNARTDINKKIKYLKNKLEMIQKESAKAKNESSKLRNEYNSALSDLRIHERNLGIAQSNLESARNLKNNYIELISNTTTKKEEQQKTVDEVTDHLNHMKYCKELMSNGGIEKHAMDRMIKALNGEINKNLRRLSCDYSVVMTSDMNYYFDNTSKGTHPQFQNFSKGEQARISIATCLAFKTFLSNRSGFTSNIVLVDEYIDGNVDTQAIKDIFELLKDQAQTFNQTVYLISHRPEIKNESFDHVIEIHRKDRLSSVKIVS